MRLSAVAVGLGAAVAGTATLMAAGAAQRRAPCAPLNTLAEALIGGGAGDRPEFNPRATPVGLAVMFVGLTGWGIAYRRLFGRVPPPTSLLTGALAGTALYLLDYHLAPPGRRPGFERYLTWPAISLKYAAVGLALGLLGPEAS